MALVSQEFGDEVLGAMAKLSSDIGASGGVPTVDHKARMIGIRTTAEQLLAEARTVSNLHGGKAARLFYQAVQEGTAAAKAMQRGMNTMSDSSLREATNHMEKSTRLAREASALFNQEGTP